MELKTFVLFIQFFLLTTINCQTCRANLYIDDTNCFNDLIIFNLSDKYYRAGHFAMNTKGDMIIEYSYLQCRLFYGLKKNGKLYYPETIKEIEIASDTVPLDSIRRYESINLFVSTVNDYNKTKEYLMSISSWITILELYDLENNDFKIKESISFFEQYRGTYSYVFQVLEAKVNNNINYFCIYLFLVGEEYQHYQTYLVIQKFNIANFNTGPIKSDKIDTIQTRVVRITSAIIFENSYTLAIFFLPYSSSNYIYYRTNFYDYALIQKGEFGFSENVNSMLSDGAFFKALNLYDNYAAFLYFTDERLYYLRILYFKESSYSFDYGIYYNDDKYALLRLITLNDFVKINENRLALISTREGYDLFIILYDFYNNYQLLKVRYYRYIINSNKISSLTKELSAFVYNGFLSLTSTALPQSTNSNNDNFFSILLIFGYANGTDFEINIYPYLMDSDNYDNSNNLYTYLMGTMKIDNNIFGYEKVEQIKLISIPDEIKFFNGIDNSTILNNDTIDANYILKQSDNIIKNDDFYYLDYQFIVKEQEYSSFYSNSYLADEGLLSNDASSFFSPRILYGRTNTLKFKLCHNNCKTCYKMGNTIVNQKCESCLENLTYFNIDNPSNCVPQGYYLDIENESLEQCTTDNSKHYTDNNKIICIKNTYDCPNSYPYYDEITKECKDTPPEETTILMTQKTEIISQTINNPKPTLITKTETLNNPKTTVITKTEINNNPKTTEITKTEINNNLKTTEITKTEINNNLKTTETAKANDEKINTEEIAKVNETEKNINSNQVMMTNALLELNMTNEEIIEKINNEFLNNYQVGDESLEIKGENNTVFQLTTTDNEMKKFTGSLLNNNGLSIVDLGDCETSLKEYYGIDEDASLIIKKYEQITISAERNVQYEVYHPVTKQKLNLSVCEKDTIDLYVPVQLNDKLIELYEDLQNSGYDLFNIDDPFYNDLCSPYKSENGTDVLLSDRKNDYYNNNYTTCQANCQYSSFNSEYQFLKCECKVIVDDIDINDFDKFSKKIYKNFYDILKNSNYKTLKCYNLVFNLGHLKKNIGSFVVIAFFVGYVCFFSIYIVKGITPLQNEVVATLSSKFKDVDINTIKNSLVDEKVKNNKDNIYKRKSVVQFPPKKRKTVSIVESDMEKDENKKKKRKSKKLKKTKSVNTEKRKSRNENILSKIEDEKGINTESKKNILEDTEKNKIPKKRKSKGKVYNIDQIIPNEKLDDLDLNNLPYEKAVDLDKRNFSQIYWSRLKGKHLFIFTFISCNDHNLVYIKIARFLFLICTSMAMNVIFFFDSSMHKIYLDYGKYNFIQQIPQIIYSSIVSLIIEILIGMLSYTDNKIYEIRQIEEYDQEKIKKIVKSIKIKLVIFFIVTFIFFAFYWYLITSFCAVYNNTQVIYMKDFATSFTLGLIYPFAIQLCFALLRIFTLRDKKKSRSFLYKFC